MFAYVCVYVRIVTLLHIKTLTILTGLTMVQEGSLWSIITEDCFKSQTSVCEIFGKQNDIR